VSNFQDPSVTYVASSTEPDDKEVLWVDTSDSVHRLKRHDGTEWTLVSPDSIGIRESAETFQESGVTVNHDKTSLDSNDNIVLKDEATMDDTTTGTRSADDTQGILFTPTEALDVIEVRSYSVNTTDLDNVGVRLHSDGSLVSSQTKTISPGETITFSGLGLSSGTRYRVTGDMVSDGDNHADTQIQDPGDVLGLDGAIDQGSVEESNTWAFDRLRGHVSSGSATVEWTHPNNVWSWDRASWMETPNGETIDVYLEEDDGGWSEIAGPIDKGDLIPAAASNNVRLRFDLSEANGGVPEVNAAHRRYLL
jgi:hypothetical protein